MTKEEFRDKVEWEGGVMEAVDYGLKVTDLPDDVPAKVADAWHRLESALRYIDVIDAWLDTE